MSAILFILDTLITLVVVAFLLRVVMPLARADFRQPLGQAVLRFTDPLVKPLRQMFKPAGKVDVASIVALLLVQVAGTAVLLAVQGYGLSPVFLFVRAVFSLLRTVLQFYTFAIFINVLLSWVSPGTYNPAAQLLYRICEPLLGPVRRIVPPIAGLDLSPLFVLIGLQALQMLLR